jgi:aspartokinase-like uncharacterized kinase
VVKIGGSLAKANDSQLADWLNVLSKSKQTIILVPGGGPFADQVRLLQSRWNYSNETAHHMAILAMQQYGLMLADLSPVFECCSSVLAIKLKLNLGLHSMIWMPSIVELDADQVTANWDVSSDSLAAWLSEKLKADRLILIKSVKLSQRKDISIQSLQADNIVDQAFHRMMRRVENPLTVLGCDQLDLFPDS